MNVLDKNYIFIHTQALLARITRKYFYFNNKVYGQSKYIAWDFKLTNLSRVEHMLK